MGILFHGLYSCEDKRPLSTRYAGLCSVGSRWGPTPWWLRAGALLRAPLRFAGVIFRIVDFGTSVHHGIGEFVHFRHVYAHLSGPVYGTHWHQHHQSTPGLGHRWQGGPAAVTSGNSKWILLADLHSFQYFFHGFWHCWLFSFFLSWFLLLYCFEFCQVTYFCFIWWFELLLMRPICMCLCNWPNYSAILGEGDR